MVISSTNVSSSAALVGQGGLDRTASSERSLRVRVGQSERRPDVTANKSAKKIPGFFEKTASRFQSWKESRNEAALKKAAYKAGIKIAYGFYVDNFKWVHQGLKHLHNAEQKCPKNGEQVSARVRAAVAAVYSNGEINLQKFARGKDELVNQHSDRYTLFHRMLKGLAKIGLVPKSYVDKREERIATLDNKIKESLLSIQRNFFNNQICHEKDDSYDAYVELIHLGHEDVPWEQAVEKIADNAISNKNPFDLYRLHLCYAHDNYQSERFNKEQLLQQAINGGCLEAEYYLACRNQKGKIEDHRVIFPEDRPTIVSELKRLAEKGHVEAQYKLALIYENSGLNTEETREGMKFLYQLAEFGHLPSKRELIHGKNDEKIPFFTWLRWQHLLDIAKGYNGRLPSNQELLYGTNDEEIPLFYNA